MIKMLFYLVGRRARRHLTRRAADRALPNALRWHRTRYSACPCRLCRADASPTSYSSR